MQLVVRGQIGSQSGRLQKHTSLQHQEGVARRSGDGPRGWCPEL